MTKITNLEAKTYQGKPSGFKITFDDGRTGNLTEKESDKGLRVGDDVIVTEVPYTSKAGAKSTLYGARLMQTPAAQSSNAPLSTPQPPPKPLIHVGAGKSKEEVKSEAYTQILLKILDFFYVNKLESAQVSVYLKDFGGLIGSEIDEIYGSK